MKFSDRNTIDLQELIFKTHAEQYTFYCMTTTAISSTEILCVNTPILYQERQHSIMYYMVHKRGTFKNI